MSDNREFDLDIDSILAEFSSYSETLSNPGQSGGGPAAPAKAETSVPAGIQAPPRPARQEAARRPAYEPAVRPREQGPRPAAETQRRPSHEAPRRAYETEQGKERRAQAVHKRKTVPDPERLGYGRGRAAGAEKPRRERPEPEQAAVRPLSPAQRRGQRLAGMFFAAITMLSLCWIFVNVHPDSGTVNSSGTQSGLNLVSRLDEYANNAASDALSELTYIPKIYAIPESAIVAPKPDPAKFGSTTDPGEIQAVIDAAAVLLNGQTLTFNPEAKFVAGSVIQYYLDDTILVITWQEEIEGKCVTCSEVKIANGSQLRRKVAGDTYSVGVRYYATDMAKECNAVVAINGDFYDFRQIGVTVYQRKLFRFAPDKLDSCHFTSSGDMLFSYAGELTDEASTQQFVDDNDVLFTVSFGPILVDNGELRTVGSYPIGEIDRTYSRSAIGQLGELHYLLMSVNYGEGYTVTATMNQMGQFMYGKGCQKAYALDGGQTSIIVMNGQAANHVDWGNERTMSDLIYFATAIPEEEAAQ